jgi:hypothetical protein
MPGLRQLNDESSTNPNPNPDPNPNHNANANPNSALTPWLWKLAEGVCGVLGEIERGTARRSSDMWLLGNTIANFASLDVDDGKLLNLSLSLTLTLTTIQHNMILRHKQYHTLNFFLLS